MRFSTKKLLLAGFFVLSSAMAGEGIVVNSADELKSVLDSMDSTAGGTYRNTQATFSTHIQMSNSGGGSTPTYDPWTSGTAMFSGTIKRGWNTANANYRKHAPYTLITTSGNTIFFNIYFSFTSVTYSTGHASFYNGKFQNIGEIIRTDISSFDDAAVVGLRTDASGKTLYQYDMPLITIDTTNKKASINKALINGGTSVIGTYGGMLWVNYYDNTTTMINIPFTGNTGRICSNYYANYQDKISNITTQSCLTITFQ